MQTDDAKQSGVAKTHPHHHTTHHHPRGPGPKLAPKATDLSAALENMHISTHEGKPGSAAAQTAPPVQQQHHHLHPNAHLNAPHLAPQGQNNNPRSAGYSPHSANTNRSAGPGGFSPSLNDFVAAQNGARLLAALAAGPGGVPMQFPQPAPNAPGRQHQPAPLAFPGHPIGMPLGLPTMPLTPPAAAAYFPQLSAGHPPLYDFAALQQQHLLELAAAQQAIQSQGPNAPLSPPTNLTPGVSPATGQRNEQNAINAAAIALLQQGIAPPGFAPFPGAGFGGPGFYPSPTDPSYNPDLAAAMARAIPQYTAALAAAAAAQAQYGGVDANTVAALNLAGSPNGTNGPSANNRKLGLYKTELCRSWEEKGTCRYGPKCQFAHGEEELRKVQRHPKYKTEICRTFWVSGSCPYGKRCCFIHTELPGPGGAGAEGATTPNGTSAPATATTPNNAANAPERTPSANSSSADGTEKEQSLLARINAKRDNKDDASTPTFQVSRPGLGSLRVDTSALDGGAAVKQNKSAFPTFASNQTIPSVDPRNEAPPATAGPEFGRQRLEVLGLPKGGNTHSRSLSGSADTNTGSLHQSSRSLSGAGNLTPLVAGNTPDSATAPTQAPVPAPTVSHGHSRSTSGSQWRPGATGQGQVGAPTLGALSAFPRESNEASPWAQAATAAPTSRYPNRAWAS